MNDAQHSAVGLAPLVRIGQPRGGLTDDVNRVLERQVVLHREAALDDVGGRLAVDVLHRDVLHARFVGHVVDVDDRRVIQLRRQACLVQEHRHHARVLGVLRLQHLEHDRLSNPPIASWRAM